jgi:hypothetical protein
MAQEFFSRQIVPVSGIYCITHRPPHSQMPEEVTLLRGRWFPDCPVCTHISFELRRAAKDVRDVEPLEDLIGDSHSADQS